MRLGIEGFNYADLYQPRRLSALSDAFWASVEQADAPLFEEFQQYRQSSRVKDDPAFPSVRISRLLVATARHLSTFLSQLFLVQTEADELAATTRRDAVIFDFKKSFIQRRVRKLDAATVLEAVNNFARLDADVSRLRSQISHITPSKRAPSPPSPARMMMMTSSRSRRRGERSPTTRRRYARSSIGLRLSASLRPNAFQNGSPGDNLSLSITRSLFKSKGLDLICPSWQQARSSSFAAAMDSS